MEEQKKIDWEGKWAGSSQFVRLIAGKPCVLQIVSVKDTETRLPPDEEGIVKVVPCLEFRIVKENNVAVDKTWSVTSKKLAHKMRPFIERGFPFTIQAVQYGTRFDRDYEITLLSSGAI